MDRSLALEGIDSSRKWPSMSDTSRSQAPVKSSEHRVIERKPENLQQADTRRRHYPQKQQSTSSSAMTTATTSMSAGWSNSRVKEAITKDSSPRKWICKQVPVKTLGGEMMMPIWFS
ncbi:hypothetical protein BGZ76_007045, partial [Entomortierella beljakovae]